MSFFGPQQPADAGGQEPETAGGAPGGRTLNQRIKSLLQPVSLRAVT
jgi:hypothetical protein